MGYIERKRKWVRIQRDKYEAYKTTISCQICGENHLACLDFHHKTKNDKKLRISRQIGWMSFEKVLEEIKRCDVLCANCHRKLHYDCNRIMN